MNPAVERSFTCEICIEPTSENKKFSNNKHCTHPFCLDCIAKYIQVKIEEYHTSNISCPGLNCDHLLDPLSCRSIIPASLFSKWCDLLCNGHVLDLERSYCPNRECMALVVNECGGSGTVKKAKCPNCKELFCFECKLRWHAGYRCEEAEELMRDQNDILFGQLAERMAWIRCPGCGQYIERIQGCDMVVCRCKTRFCFRCGRKCLAIGACSCGEETRDTTCSKVVVLMVLVGLVLWLVIVVKES